MRPVIAAISLVACVLGVWVCGRAGRARLLSNHINYKDDAGLLASINEAIRLTPLDPEVHHARALVLWRMEQLPEAIREYESVVALRPRDYVPWFDLGITRDNNGDEEGALSAFKEAVRLAPHYGLPRWELGNLLLRMGQRDGAFTELRRAAMSDPKLIPDVIDIAWEAYRGDARAVRQAIQPQSPQARLALARFFANHEKTTEAMDLFRAAGNVSDQHRRALLAELLAAESFNEAHEVWSSGRDTSNGAGQSGSAAIIDGGFENGISLDDTAFGWQIARDVPAVHVSLDTHEPEAGMHSLRIDWGGNYNPSTPVVSQLVLVGPKMRYRLSFAARSEKLVTGGLPMVAVVDASGDESSLSQSVLLPRGTSGWQKYSIEFTTAEAARAARITIRRQDCTTTPCPVFGRTWFDDFSMRNL